MVFFLAPIFAYVGASIPALVGFTSVGVGAGTVAALVQSSIGNVAAGSVFAAAQSAGATGSASFLGGIIGGIYGLFY